MSAARLTHRQREHFVGAPVLLASLLIVGVLMAVFRLALHGAVQPNAAVAFGIVVAAGETLRITLPGGRDNAPLAATAALGYALAPQLCGHPAQWGPVQVIVVVAVAAALGSVPQALVGRPPSVGYLVRRIGVPGFVAWLLRSVLHSVVERTVGSGLLLLLCGMACLALLLDSALGALFGTAAGPYASGLVSPGGEFEFGDPSSSPGIALLPLLVSSKEAQFGAGAERVSTRALHRFLGSWFDECMATARVCPAVAALSAAVALAAGPLGLWVLPIAAAPVLVMQRALRRYAAIRATYQQTIRALSRVTDLAGYTEPGHARRVCRLALAIGRELDLTEPELLDLEYASLLHDIGQLSLADPLPSGATVLATPWVAAEVAVRGAEVVRQTGVLDRVARVMEAQVTPYQATRLGPPRPPTVPEGTAEEMAGAASEAAATVATEPAPETAGMATAAAPEAAVAAAPGTASAATSSSGAGEVSGSTEPGAESGAESDGWVPPDASELRAAGILRVANDFEDLRTAEPGPAANARALARIRRGVGAPYDPMAVEALTRLFAPQ